MPDFHFGFTILLASTINEPGATTLVYFIMEMIASTILPEIDNIGKDQANATFGGYFVDKNTNSSLTITVDDQPGLRVSTWVNNSAQLLQPLGGSGNGTYTDFRLQPNHLYTGDKVGFTGFWQTVPGPAYPGFVNLNCGRWSIAGEVTYGNVAVEEFVFNIDGTTGKAIGVEPKALRTVLKGERDVRAGPRQSGRVPTRNLKSERHTR